MPRGGKKPAALDASGSDIGLSDDEEIFEDIEENSRKKKKGKNAPPEPQKDKNKRRSRALNVAQEEWSVS
jgi:hypothetical protein